MQDVKLFRQHLVEAGAVGLLKPLPKDLPEVPPFPELHPLWHLVAGAVSPQSLNPRCLLCQDTPLVIQRSPEEQAGMQSIQLPLTLTLTLTPTLTLTLTLIGTGRDAADSAP